MQQLEALMAPYLRPIPLVVRGSHLYCFTSPQGMDDTDRDRVRRAGRHHGKAPSYIRELAASEVRAAGYSPSEYRGFLYTLT